MSPRKKKISIPFIAFVSVISILAISAIATAITLAVLWFTADPMEVLGPTDESIKPTEYDGAGSAIVSPDIVRAGEPVPAYNVTYRTGEKGLKEGARIHLFYPSQLVTHGEKTIVLVPYTAFDSIRNFMKAPIEASCSDENVKIKVTEPSIIRALKLWFGYRRYEMKHDEPPYPINVLAKEFARRTVRVVSGDVKPNTEIKIKIGGRDKFMAPQYGGWVNFALEIDGDGDGVAKPIPTSPRVVVMGREATQFRVVANTVVNVWEKLRVTVAAIDDDGMVDPTYTGTVYLDSPRLTLPGRTTFKLSDLGRKTFTVRTTEEGVFYIKARDDRHRKGMSGPIVIREKGPHLYWGDLRLHTIFGIGDNSPEYVLRSARDEYGLDFAGIVMMDNLTPLPSHDRIENAEIVDFAWAHLQKVANIFSNDEKFVAFPIFDWADWEEGHRLVLYSPEEIGATVMSHADPRFDTVDKLLGALPFKKALVIPIWMAWRGGDYMGDKYNWGPMNEKHQRIAEIYSSDGACEFYDNPFPIHGLRDVKKLYSSWDEASRFSGSYLRDALAKGYKLGAIAGGALRFSLDRPEYYRPGRTAVWAKSLEPGDIWEALFMRRAYATTGARIFVDFRINEAYPGETVTTPGAVAIELYIAGTSSLTEVTLVKFDGKYRVARALASESSHMRSRWIDTDPPVGGFYFLRVKQEDGEMAWAGPTWITK